MGGICGFTGRMQEQESVLSRMLEKIRHRGPDGEDTLLFEETALAACRLDIPGQEGAVQPLRNETGDMALVFDGKIYNAETLRAELAESEHVFKTDSDFEVVLHAYEQYGSSVTDHLRGMYAFVIWDETNHTLFAARDPFGMKPLYYTAVEGHFVFASEIKSILEFPLCQKRMNTQALEQYLSFQYCVTTETFFRGIFRLQPGHMLVREKNTQRIEAFFDPLIRPQQLADDTFVYRLDRAVRGSIDAHTQTGGQTGVFLSGGVDSGLIASLFSGQHAYTVGFSDSLKSEGGDTGRTGAGSALYDEMEPAGKLAEESKLVFHSRQIRTEEFWDAVPEVMYYLDEPSGDPGVVAQYFAAAAAASDVKTVFSGEGADELFGGYPAYLEPRELKKITRLPRPVRSFLGKVGALLPRGIRARELLIRGSLDVEERYIGSVSVFTEKERRALLREPSGAQPPSSLLREDYARAAKMDDIAKMQYIDMIHRLPEDVLRKADRMGMAHSLEVRLPYLDPEVWKIAARLPMRARIRGKQTKYVFRRVAGAYLNRSRTDRPGEGFCVPVRNWLRQEQWYTKVLEIFSSNEARRIFHTDQLFGLMEEHWSGKRDNSRKIWTVCAFLIWYRKYGMGE